MPDTFTRDPATGASSAELGKATGYLVCLRAADYFDAEYFDYADEALDLYDNGRDGWYSTAMFACLQTTDSELTELAAIDDVARDTSTTLRVPRDALRHLLRDHYTLCTARGVSLKFSPQHDQESLR